jgi:tetratricopeptide (TPR) repeat protein
MAKKLMLLLLTGLLFPSAGLSQRIPEPKLTPATGLDKHRDLLRDAIAFDDRRDFDGAIARLQQILGENPDDVAAMYQLAYSHFGKEEYMKSLGVAYKGAKYKSQQLAAFYLLIGNNLDRLDEPELAIKVYKQGMKSFPTDAQFPMNLAITYLNFGKPEDARKSLKESAALDPNYAGSHLGLGQLYFASGYKVQAVLALCRFLVLEPDSSRSAAALKTMQGIIQSGVGPGEESNITIVVDATMRTDEGDFNAANLALSMLAASPYLEKNKGKSEMNLVVENFSTLFTVLSEGKTNQSGFAWNHYRPYFVEMKNRNYVEAFCYYIHQSGGSAEASNWLAHNGTRVSEFLNWSKSYQWPKGK